MAEDRRSPAEKLLVAVDGGVQRLFIYLVDNRERYGLGLTDLQRWEERMQATSREIRKALKKDG